MMRARRVVVIDDHEMFRQGLIALLRRDPRIVVVGQGCTSTDALSLVMALRPDIVVLDVEIDGVPTRQTLAQIGRKVPYVRVVILTMHRDSVLRQELLRAGASAVVTKNQPLSELVASLLASSDRPPAPGRPLIDEALPPRQHEVLRLMGAALSNKEIAAAMGIAEGTVKRHANELFRRLEVTSRMEAVHRGRLLGLIS